MAEQPQTHGDWMSAWTDAQRRIWESWMALGRPAGSAEAFGAGSTAGWPDFLDAWRRVFLPFAQPTAAAPWMDAWRRTWETWMAMPDLTGGGARPITGLEPWQEASTAWLRMFQPAADTGTADVGRKLVEQWAAYVKWAQSMMPAMQGLTQGPSPSVDWMTAVGRMFGQGGDGAGPGAGSQAELIRGMGAFWGLPVDMWRRVMTSLSAFPGDASLGSKESGVPGLGGMGRGQIEQFLTVPPFGYTREWQEQGQRAAMDWLAYQRAFGAFMGVMLRISMRTAELVGHRFSERATGGVPFESLRQAYDLFVDCAEDAYAEVVTAADFGKVSAELMNAAVAVKRHAQMMTEELANAANLPTRRELDTSHRQLQQMRRQLAAMQAEMRQSRPLPSSAPTTVSAEVVERLEHDIQALREELAQVKADTAAALPAAGPLKVAAPARAAAAKGRANKVETLEG